MPYLKSLKKALEDKEQLFTKTELLASDLIPVACSSETFVALRLYRLLRRFEKVGEGLTENLN